MNVLYTDVKYQGVPNYIDGNPYGNTISVDSTSSYLNTRVFYNDNGSGVETLQNYSMTPDDFATFLHKCIFRITGKSGSDQIYTETGATPSYLPGKNDTGYYAVPKIGSLYTHLAGTILSMRCVVGENNSFNCALLMDEVFDADGNTINKVGVSLRNSLPFLQTLKTVTGNVYDIKKGVTIFDLENMLEHNQNEPQGFLDLNGFQPTNKSNGKQDGINYGGSTSPYNGNSVPVLEEGDQLYKHVDGNLPSPSDSTTIGSTKFTGYFILCAFQKDFDDADDKDDLSDVMYKIYEYQPYITVLRIVNSEILNTDFNTIADGSNGNCIVKLFDKSSIDLDLTRISVNSPLSLLFDSAVTLDDTKSDSMFYFLSKLTTD